MIYDIIIIGGGPAGLSAGLYAARDRMKTLIIEKDAFGGQIVTTADVENYPGSIHDPTGPLLVDRMLKQAEEFGAEKVADTVVEVDLDEEIKVVKGEKGEYKAKAVIVATGAVPRPMDCPGEKDLIGRGVSYCATCDGAFFEGLEVFVVGGGDSAVEEAMYLTRFARKVTIIHRRDELRAAKSIQEKAFKNDKIEFIWDSVVTEVKGEGILESFTLKNRKTGEITEMLPHEDEGTFGIFVFVGYLPATGMFEGLLDMEDDYLVSDDNMHTKIDGVFVAGDNRVKTLRQVVTATSDGAIAAVQAGKYISDNFED